MWFTCCFCFSAWSLHACDVNWTKRRKRWTVLELAQLITQTLNTIAYVIPNLWLVLYGNDSMERYMVEVFAALRFTTWNTMFFLFVLQARVLNLWVDKCGRPLGDEDGILLDAPWKCHWFTAVLWALFEAGFLFVGWFAFEIHGESGKLEDLCTNFSQLRGVIWLVSLMFAIYEAAALYYVYVAFQQLKKKSYTVFRWVNIRVRYHHIQIWVVETFVILSFFVLSYIRIEDCPGTMLVLFGLIPAQISTTVLSIVNSYLMTPMRLGLHVLNLRHTIAWAESEVQARWTGKRSGFSKYRVPSFCFETALKLWYFSLVTYRWVINDKEITIDIAKELYGLDKQDLIYIQESDISVVVSWNVQKSLIVVAFRGTKSTENVITDLKAWRTVLPPKEGHLMLGTQPLVHEGFYRVWCTAGLNHRILNRIIEVSLSEGFNLDTCHIMVTGHSMGGAVAVLAAYDISRYTGISGSNITCHTFGAPCVGNAAFQRSFDASIRDTWQIVNGNDFVPSLPDFGPFFVHVGKRVLVNESGDIILNPLSIEYVMTRIFLWIKGSSSMTHHLMRNYKKSLQAIARAQYIKRKGLPGGMTGMDKLTSQGESGVFQIIFKTEAKSFKELHRLGTRAWGPQEQNWIRRWRMSQNKDVEFAEDNSEED